MTRRDALPQVLRGLDAVAADPRLRPVKVNAVALRGFSEEEALPFARFARERGFQVRFIEYMPLDGDRDWKPDQVLTGEELRAIIEREHPRRDGSASPRQPRAYSGSPMAARARSGSSTPSPNRSAPTATGSG